MDSKARIQEFSTNQKNFQYPSDQKVEPLAIFQSAHQVYFDNQNFQKRNRQDVTRKQRDDHQEQSIEVNDEEHHESKAKILESEQRQILRKGVSYHKNK